MKNINRDRVVVILRWSLALIFIYAGIGKILNPASFVEDIDNYRILPYVLVTIAAVILPCLEIISGLLLIIGKFQKGAALALLGLTFIFLIAIASAVIRGLDISCGCFVGTGESNKIGYTRLAEEVLFFAFTFFIYLKTIVKS